MEFGKLWFVFKISALLLHSLQITGDIPDCQASHNCPPENRFCTPVGCVHQCPENSFQNGSMCVLSCGDWFVFNNTCRDVCPPSMSLTVENISVIGGVFKKTRSCVNECKDFDPALLEYNGKCERQCPFDAQFILENSCSQKCPGMYPFLWQHDRYGNNVTECMKSCPNFQPYIDDKKVCVQECPNTRKFVLNGSCVKNCTDAMPYYTNILGNLYCHRSCESKFILNRECIDMCDQNYYISGNTCVKECPPAQPLIETKRTYGYNYGSGQNRNVCVTECSEYELRDDLNCVNNCPLGTHIFNKSCVKTCPASAPYSHNSCVNCNPWSESSCHQQCPGTTFRLNFTCLETCPNFLFNNTCVLACPIDTVRKDTMCYDKCPNGTRLNGTECISCDLQDKDMCVEACPSQRPHNENGICVEKCSFGNIGYDFICVPEARCNRSITFDGHCLDACPDGMYWYWYKEDTNTYDSYNRACYRKSVLGRMLNFSLFGLLVLILIGFCCCRFEPWSVCRTCGRKLNVYKLLPQNEAPEHFDGASQVV